MTFFSLPLWFYIICGLLMLLPLEFRLRLLTRFCNFLAWHLWEKKEWMRLEEELRRRQEND